MAILLQIFIFIYGYINKSIEDALVFVDLTLDYDEWVAKVWRTAEKLENLGRYRPKNSKFTETWLINETIVTKSVTTQEEKICGVDYDGDTIMKGNPQALMNLERRKIGRRQESLEQSGKQSQVRQLKSNAPWCPKSEFYRLIENGLCTRCAKSGHQSRQCPSFRGPKRQEPARGQYSIYSCNRISGKRRSLSKDAPRQNYEALLDSPNSDFQLENK